MTTINIRYNGELMPESLTNFLINEQSVKGHSINTINNYKSDLVQFLKYTKKNKKNLEKSLDQITLKAIGNDFLNSITYNDAIKYVNYITYEKLDRNGNVKGDIDSTRARKVNAIKSFFLFLEQTGVIENNPMVKLSTPKVGKKEVVFMNVDESRQLLNSVKKFNGEYKDRDYAIVTILLNCALRRSEIVALNVDSIKGDKLYISGKGNKERTVDLTPACMNAIQKYLPYRPDVKDENGEPLFVSERNKRVCKETVALVVKKYVKKAGLNPKYTTHKIRHTSASLMYQNMEKKDIKALQEILGHESIITTQIYTHIDSESKRTAIYSNPLANEI